MSKKIENKQGDMISVPRMEGSNVNERLVNLVEWRDKNLRDWATMTLQQIGDGVGATRELIRQIEATALKKCRQGHNTNRLRK